MFLQFRKYTNHLTVTNSRNCSLLVSMLFSLAVFAQPKYEFRAAWVATVSNIDWPSSGNYNSELQKKEFI
ncbi:MAG: hypothetical protein ABI151_08345, partial [Chitinophagaceae bacterium]